MVETLERRQLFAAFSAHINFQPAGTPIPPDYVADTGATYATRSNGINFGWNALNEGAMRDRNSSASSDQRYDTFAHMQKTGYANRWEISVPNGTYKVHIVAGDPTSVDSIYRISAENTLVVSGTPGNSKHWFEGTSSVTVKDGRLTIANASGAVNNKINFIDITPAVTTPLPAINWQQMKDAPVSRGEAAGASVNGKLYVVGGFIDSSLTVTKELDIYNPATNTWSVGAPCPVAMTHGRMVPDGTNLWLLGFFLNDGVTASKLVYKYDTITNKWSTGPSLPASRGAGGAAMIGRELHFFGGLTGPDFSASDHWALDLNNPAAGWKTRARLPKPINHQASIAFQGKIWSIGGFINKEEDHGNLASVYVYNPTSDTWTTGKSLPLARGHVIEAVAELNDHIVLFGGSTNGSSESQLLKNVTAYDPVANVWQELSALPSARQSVIGRLVGNYLVVTGGNSPGVSDETWVAKIK